MIFTITNQEKRKKTCTYICFIVVLASRWMEGKHLLYDTVQRMMISKVTYPSSALYEVHFLIKSSIGCHH